MGENLNKFNFLIVDDDDVIVSIVESALEEIGAKNVNSVSEGEKALEHYDASLSGAATNIILLDLNMPGMDGIEFLRHIAQREFKGDIILMSGEDKAILKSAGDLARTHNLSVAAVVEKPVTLESLKQAIHNIENKQVPADKANCPAIDITEDDLREALEKDQLVMYFQPKVDVKTKKIVSVESLVRWVHPEEGLIPPDVFIPLAEQTGMIILLTNQVIAKSIAEAGRWHEQGYDIKVGFNVSVENLETLELPEYIFGQALDADVDPKKIIVEVTESRIMADLAKTYEILTRLRLKGIELSIDDFGTGYSTMEQLERIPFTELKIDKAFVTYADKKPKSRAILESSISLAKNLGLRIVAEGVERQEEWDLVKVLGVDLVQGYYISKPLSAADLLAWLKETQ